MKIGLAAPAGEPFSMRSYRANIMSRLSLRGVQFVNFLESGFDAESDLLWDYMAFGGRPPLTQYRHSQKPCVVTQHGARPLTVPLAELWRNPYMRWRQRFKTFARAWIWARIDKSRFFYVAVSEHTKREAMERIGLPGERVRVVHHGVDHAKFQPDPDWPAEAPFFLHVSQYQPVKNIDRVIEAYTRLDPATRPPMRLIVSGYTGNPKEQGLVIHHSPVSEEDLIRYYRTASAFIFPSLHEGFGMPLLEAMASGCPVLTSNVTACPEVAGGAAILVDPRATDQIADGMRRLAEDEALRRDLREKGLKRAAQFTWDRCAEGHLSIFEWALAPEGQRLPS